MIRDKKQSDDITRRSFAKTSAAVASFAVIGAKASTAANSDTLKVGVVGCGGRGSGAAIDICSSDNNVKLVAMADVFKDQIDKAIAKIKKHKVASLKFDVDEDMCFVGLDAYKKLLKTDIDIVIFATPPYARPMHIEAAVKAKKHIFAEKPVATDPAGIKQVLEAAAKHKQMGLSFVAGTQRRHQKEYIETVKKIQDGALGDVIAFRAYWNGRLPWVRPNKPEYSQLEWRLRNWYSYCWLSGDNITEQHVHNLDVCNWIMGGPPKSVVASGGRTWKPNTEEYGDIFDHFCCDYEYENDVHMFSSCRHWYNATGSVMEQALCAKGATLCDALGKPGENAKVQEHIDFVNSIIGKDKYLHEGEQVAQSTMTAIMGRISAYTGLRQGYESLLNSGLKIVPDDLDFGKKYPVGPVPMPGAPKEKA